MLDRVIRFVRLAGRTALRAGVTSAVLFLLAAGVGPFTGAYRTVTVLTGSMRPNMPAGSLAVVVPVNPSSVKVGDVITYQAPIADHRVVTHRVFKILEPGPHPVVVTKGDANVSPDPWAARLDSAPTWRRVAVVPYAGTAIRALRNPQVHRLSVEVVPALLFVSLVAGIWSRGSKQDESDKETPATAAPPAPVVAAPVAT